MPQQPIRAFGPLLRHHRLRRGMTQGELASSCGLSVAAIRDLEQQRTRLPRQRSVRALADALKLETEKRDEFEKATRLHPRPSPDGDGDQPVTVGILGPLLVRRGCRESEVASARQRQLLARLALSPNVTVGRDELIDLLWEGDVPASVFNVLQTHVARLRRVLRVNPVVDECLTLSASPGGYRLGASAATLDTLQFTELVSRARETDPESAADLLKQAFALWRGDALADVAGFRTHPLITGLQEQRIAAALALADVVGTVPDDDLVAVLRLQAAHHPLHEPLQARFMLALAAAGRRGEALHHYQDLRRRLAETLGIDPGDELVAAHVAILRRLPSPAAAVAAPEPDRPAQLPLPMGHLVGRQRHVDELDDLLTTTASATPVVILEGGAGVGKTSLAVHWAHRVAERFSDGQVYIDFKSGGEPLSAMAALRGLLPSFGVPSRRIPTDDDALVGLYRTLVHGRRLLIVLDNVRDADQVRPLVPGTGGCMVLVTSRARLTGLVTTHAAVPMPVNLLTTEDSTRLLEHRLGTARTQREPTAVARLVKLCDGLPLALAIVSARAAAESDMSLEWLAERLGAGRGDLSAFSIADAATDIRAVFSWSYEQLSAPAARMFRHLSLHPPVDLSVEAAASIAGISPGQALSLLTELSGTHLVNLHTGGRCGLQDLLRSYANERCSATDWRSRRREALKRMLDHYLHTAHPAARLLDPNRTAISLPERAPHVHPVELRDAGQARAWFTAEHPALMSVIDHAATHDFDDHAWRLAWALTDFLQRQGFWHDWVRAQELALGAVERVGDRLDIAHTTRGLGRAYAQLGDVEAARRYLTEAFEQYAHLGERLSQARTLRNLAYVLGRHGRCEEALTHAEKALTLYRADDDQAEYANTLNVIGWHLALKGDHTGALPLCERALSLLQDTEDRRGMGVTWDSLGYIGRGQSDLNRSYECYQAAVAIFVDIGDRHNEAESRMGLAHTCRALGRDDEADTAERVADRILRELGDGSVPPYREPAVL